MGPSEATPHFPGQAPIESYGRGGFRFAGMSHRGSLLCLPSGIWAWPVQDVGEIDELSLERVLAEAASIGLLLVGTGRERVALPMHLMQLLARKGIVAESSRTGQATHTYNILLEERRRVAAALIAVD